MRPIRLTLALLFAVVLGTLAMAEDAEAWFPGKFILRGTARVVSAPFRLARHARHGGYGCAGESYGCSGQAASCSGAPAGCDGGEVAPPPPAVEEAAPVEQAPADTVGHYEKVPVYCGNGRVCGYRTVFVKAG